jgi:hypothetical protein
MRSNVVRLLALAVSAGGLLLVPGCTFLADAFSPAIFTALGLDPGAIFPPRGTVIVVFANQTSYPAAFSAFESVDAQDLSQDSRNFSVQAAANETRNEVLDCPVGLVGPGTLDTSFASDLIVARVQTPTGVVDVPYGFTLTGGTDFVCGDVVEFTLTTTGSGQNQTFSVGLRVVPGS